MRGLFFGQEQEPSCLWSRSKTLALLGIGADVCSSLPQVISKHLTWTFLLRRAKNESRGIPQSGSSARSDSSSTMDTPSFSSIGGPRVPQSGALEGLRSRGSIGASARRVSERKSRSTPAASQVPARAAEPGGARGRDWTHLIARGDFRPFHSKSSLHQAAAISTNFCLAPHAMFDNLDLRSIM